VIERGVELPDVEATRAQARALAALLQPGDFIGLQGELGAGKTEFSRALCIACGVDPKRISSPTFAIVQAYEGGRLPLHHADLYRLADSDELYATGFFDLVGGESAMLVEWIDQIPDAAPPDHLWVTISVTGPDTRRLTARAQGARHAALLQAWLG
jgi:tRNA threonylcarbamoyladenosine biosynthesis protein TsaE